MTQDVEPTRKPGPSRQVVILLVVLALFGGVFLAKAMTASNQADGTGQSNTVSGAGGGTITSTHNDAVAAYDAALKTGRPVYVLFHSLTCDPCVEISAVADEVMPDYEGKVVFVNAITDDPSGQQLATKFDFQYIPTSFFLDRDGSVADSFTGAMDDAQMRDYLDSLVAGR